MRFSLILATVNRVKEVKRFLQSLAKQTYTNFELIVVDQNPDNRLVPILDAFKSVFYIVHLRSTPGLSRARNIGLRYIKGDIVAFPDDDCWYPPHLLERVSHIFTNTSIDGVTGMAVDGSGKPLGGWDKKPGFLNIYNVWRRAISYTIFLRNEVVCTLGEFDENLGVGASTPWGSGEETDYLLKAIKKGFSIYYEPTIKIYHPQKNISSKKALHYARGMGYVLRKHQYSPWFFIYWQLRSLVGIGEAIIRGDWQKAMIRWAYVKGRLQGWRAISRDKEGNNGQ